MTSRYKHFLLVDNFDVLNSPGAFYFRVLFYVHKEKARVRCNITRWSFHFIPQLDT